MLSRAAPHQACTSQDLWAPHAASALWGLWVHVRFSSSLFLPNFWNKETRLQSAPAVAPQSSAPSQENSRASAGHQALGMAAGTWQFGGSFAVSEAVPEMQPLPTAQCEPPGQLLNRHPQLAPLPTWFPLPTPAVSPPRKARTLGTARCHRAVMALAVAHRLTKKFLCTFCFPPHFPTWQ